MYLSMVLKSFMFQTEVDESKFDLCEQMFVKHALSMLKMGN